MVRCGRVSNHRRGTIIQTHVRIGGTVLWGYRELGQAESAKEW
jgi:hypothetical protein